MMRNTSGRWSTLLLTPSGTFSASSSNSSPSASRTSASSWIVASLGNPVNSSFPFSILPR